MASTALGLKGTLTHHLASASAPGSLCPLGGGIPLLLLLSCGFSGCESPGPLTPLMPVSFPYLVTHPAGPFGTWGLSPDSVVQGPCTATWGFGKHWASVSSSVTCQSSLQWLTLGMLEPKGILQAVQLCPLIAQMENLVLEKRERY